MRTFLFILIAFQVYADTLTIIKVKDGDTFLLSDSSKVRLIGVDTPEKFSGSKLNKDSKYCNIEKEEMKKWGEKSTIFCKQFLNKKVIVKYDKDTIDYYKRKLVYLYLLNDSISINQHIIEQGYGKAYIKYPFKFKVSFVASQIEAKENKKGLWQNKKFYIFAK